jgi:hypothetical protein
LPVSTGAPPATGSAAAVDTGNTGNQSKPILATDESILAILAIQEISNERFDPAEWRIEVYTNRNGRRYWNWRRRGKRGGEGNWRYGGKFEDLSTKRQEQYWQRSQKGD